MEKQIIWYMVARDEAPDLQVRFDGLDLSEYSQIKMRIQKESGIRLTKTVTPDGVDPELGFVSWVQGDLTVGDHKAEFEFTQSGDGKNFTMPKKFPVLLKVRADLG